MKLEIVNNSTWKKVYIKLLNKERIEVFNQELIFKNKVATIDIDLYNAFYMYLNNGKESTEIMYLSENINQIELRYNSLRKEVDAYFVNPNIKYNIGSLLLCAALYILKYFIVL